MAVCARLRCTCACVSAPPFSLNVLKNSDCNNRQQTRTATAAMISIKPQDIGNSHHSNNNTTTPASLSAPSSLTNVFHCKRRTTSTCQYVLCASVLSVGLNLIYLESLQANTVSRAHSQKHTNCHLYIDLYTHTLTFRLHPVRLRFLPGQDDSRNGDAADNKRSARRHNGVSKHIFLVGFAKCQM